MDGLQEAELPVSVVLPDEPSTRRTGLIVGVVLLVLAAVAAGIFVLARDGADDDNSYSLELAVGAASELDQVAYLVTSEAMGEVIEIDVVADPARQRSQMTVSAGEFLDAVEMIVDLDGKVVYMSTDAFEDFGPDVDTPWIALDEEFADATGLGSIFNDAAGSEVLNAGDLLDGAQTVDDLGLEDVDGEQLRHYRVVVDAETALAANPGAGEQIEATGGEIPEQITYDMWVSEGNQLRRVASDIDIGPGIVSTLIVIRPLDEPTDIQLPPPDEVTQAADLL